MSSPGKHRLSTFHVMDRSQLTPEEYGAVALSPAAAAELSKDEIIARWSERFERLKASSARQVSELSEEVARLQAQVASLRALLDENGLSEDGGLSLEEALAVMTTGVKPAAPARSGAGGIVPPSAPLALAPAALTSLSGLHSSQNVIAVVVAGRLVELEDAPALLFSGGADRRIVASLLDTEGRTLQSVSSLPLPAPVLDVCSHPLSLSPAMDGALVAAGLMDGTVALIRFAVDLSVPVPLSARPAISATLLSTVKDHSKFIIRTKWSPDGNQLAVCSQDHRLTVYSLGTDPFSLAKRFGNEFTGTVETIEYVTVYDSPIIPEGKVSASFLVCAVRDSSTLFYINTETSIISRVGISEDSSAPILASSASPDGNFTRVGFAVLDLAASPNGNYLAVATDHGLHFLYKPGTSIILKRLVGHSVNDMSSVRCCWHPTSDYFLSTSDKENCVFVWEVNSQAIVGRICQHSSRVRGVSMWHDIRAGPSAYVLSCSFDKSVTVWPAPWTPTITDA